MKRKNLRLDRQTIHDLTVRQVPQTRLQQVRGGNDSEFLATYICVDTTILQSRLTCPQ